MKIFSNFDTKFREKMLEKKRQKFSSDKILVIRRSKFYFLFRVFIPGILLFSLLIGANLLIFRSFWFLIFLVPFDIIILLIFWFRPGYKLFKYLYDFTVVDPHGISTYKQIWILHSSLKEIPAGRIRSIKLERNSLLENIFGYGSISIHTDFTDNMHIWEDNEAPFVISLSYVDKPFKVKTQISDICFD